MNKKKINDILKIEVDNEKVKKIALYFRCISYTICRSYTAYLYI